MAKAVNFTGNVIPSQKIVIAEFVKNLPGRKSNATAELVFLATQLPPLGTTSYYVQPASTEFQDSKEGNDPRGTISNEVYKKTKRFITNKIHRVSNV